MFQKYVHNNVDCDLYIGAGAGKQVADAINMAKETVKIISPYLSAYTINKLISLSNRGVKICVIATCEVSEFHIYKKLISQSKTINKKAVGKRKIFRLYSYIMAALFILVLGLGLMQINAVSNNIGMEIQQFLGYSNSIMLLCYIVGLIFVGSIFVGLMFIIRRKKIYDYSYRSVFPIKFLLKTNNADNHFVHSKVYIIDDSDAYLGSLNFTKSGFGKNYESRIKINDIDAVQNLSKVFDSLYMEPNYELGIAELGANLYEEPIN